MKRTILLFCLCCINFISFSQQRFPEQWLLNFSGSYLPKNGGFGFQVGTEKFIGRSYNFLKLDILYNTQDFKTAVEKENIKVNSYLINFGYGYSLEKFIPSPLYINLNIGGLLGYEDINKKLTTSILNANDKFIYGISGGVQLEITTYKNISLFIEPKLHYVINSDIQDIAFLLNAGIKFYL